MWSETFPMIYGGFSLLRRYMVRPVLISVASHIETGDALLNTREVDVFVQLRNVRELNLV